MLSNYSCAASESKYVYSEDRCNDFHYIWDLTLTIWRSETCRFDASAPKFTFFDWKIVFIISNYFCFTNCFVVYAGHMHTTVWYVAHKWQKDPPEVYCLLLGGWAIEMTELTIFILGAIKVVFLARNDHPCRTGFWRSSSKMMLVSFSLRPLLPFITPLRFY